jgi:4-nitrophenyl phosphatase
MKLDPIDTLLIDMDGVLYRGSTPVAGLGRFFDFLYRRPIKFMLTSNNSTKTPEEYSEKLREMGVEVDPSLILTSGVATALYLRDRFKSPMSLYVIGENSLKSEILKANPGCILTDESPDAVVTAVDYNLNYEMLKKACILIREGRPFIATNPDKTFPAEDALYPGTGALVAFLETCSDVKATVIGKPNTVMFDLALKQLGSDKRTTAVLGDRLETDMLGAHRAGLEGILVLTGITSLEDLNPDNRPDLVFEGVGELADVWDKRLG